MFETNIHTRLLFRLKFVLIVEVSELVLSQYGDYFTDMHVDFGDIERYLRENIYPDGIKDKGKKANFRKACKSFSIINGQFMYKSNRLVIDSEKKQQEIIRDIHVGLGDAPQAKSLSSHRGRDVT